MNKRSHEIEIVKNLTDNENKRNLVKIITEMLRYVMFLLNYLTLF